MSAPQGQGGEAEAIRRPGRKGTRAVVSVAFSAAEFERVSTVAELLGMKVSTFIRKVALGQIQGGNVTGLSSAGSTFTVMDRRKL